MKPKTSSIGNTKKLNYKNKPLHMKTEQYKLIKLSLKILEDNGLEKVTVFPLTIALFSKIEVQFP